MYLIHDKLQSFYTGFVLSITHISKLTIIYTLIYRIINICEFFRISDDDVIKPEKVGGHFEKFTIAPYLHFFRKVLYRRIAYQNISRRIIDVISGNSARLKDKPEIFNLIRKSHITTENKNIIKKVNRSMIPAYAFR